MKINSSKDCGNSPKQKFAEDFTIAILKKDLPYLEEHSEENLQISHNGKESESGLGLLLGYVPEKARAISIHNVISHGKKASANARLETKNSGNIEFAFFFQFSNAKGTSISEITFYKIEN